ncbi:MAG TPA: hypothetical protein VMU42_04490 [Candidatus Sulfotelmatobacter sp.]|nr:hypothetical protein [Candidatus Sulfotelmatobacter sp.]
MSEASEIAGALSAVMADVAFAAGQVAAGKPADITDLPARVAPICAAIAALPRAEALAYAPEVGALMAALDTMTGMLTERRDALRRRLEQLDAMQP